jgi:hypothetical protein
MAASWPAASGKGGEHRLNLLRIQGVVHLRACSMQEQLLGFRWTGPHPGAFAMRAGCDCCDAVGSPLRSVRRRSPSPRKPCTIAWLGFCRCRTICQRVRHGRSLFVHPDRSSSVQSLTLSLHCLRVDPTAATPAITYLHDLHLTTCVRRCNGRLPLDQLLRIASANAARNSAITSSLNSSGSTTCTCRPWRRMSITSSRESR